MNITFLIGNGFDRQMGLDTGYDQFLEWYIQQPSENDSIREYKEALKADPQSAWWSDAEKAMGEYIGRFEATDMGNFYKQIRDFKIRLAEYLKIQENRCDFSDINRISESFAKFMCSFQDDIILQDKVGNLFSQEQDTSYCFITFNYTSVLKKLLTNYIKKGHFLYSVKTIVGKEYRGRVASYIEIHGSLNTQIIMGVNDESQINLPKERIDTAIKRTLIKPQTNAALGRTENSLANKLIEESTVLVVYGLKLGETDNKWRQIVANWLRKDGKRIVIFDHKKLEGINRLIPEDLLNYVDQKQVAFLRLLYPSINLDEIEALRDKVFVVDKTSYLDFNILKKPVADEVKAPSETNEKKENLLPAS